MGDHRHEISFVLATHNRREVILRTLREIANCGLDRGDYEIIAVDNASTDDTPNAIAPHLDQLVAVGRNAGSCAKAFGAERATGRYIVFLDDDSYPRPGSVARMIDHFEADSRLGAAGFTVHLPDGRQEGSALPGVFVGCGVGFRTEALKEVGGLDDTFFMQAEEYDLSFRLAAAGWGVEVLDDLHCEHLKTAQARKSERTTFYDVCNNLRVAARYFPSEYLRVYAKDWIQRYGWLAAGDGYRWSFVRGVLAGRWQGAMERRSYKTWRLGPDVLERFFSWERVRRNFADLASSGVRRVVLADLGKNCYPFIRGARLADITTLAIADDRFTAPRRRYRGVPVVPVQAALDLKPDAVVVANTGAVHAAATVARFASRTSLPVHSWFGSSISASSTESSTLAPRTDECDAARVCAVGS